MLLGDPLAANLGFLFLAAGRAKAKDFDLDRRRLKPG
jgi:hypothetical protein